MAFALRIFLANLILMVFFSCSGIRPANLGTDPLPRNKYSACPERLADAPGVEGACPERAERVEGAVMSTVVSSKRAGGICEATNRFQISL